MSKQTILLIEDELNIAELVKYNLQKEGFGFVWIKSGDEGLRHVIKEPPHLLLLDLMLPEMSGLEICKTLRQNPKTQSLPIIMITAKSEEADKVIGLELGADDYVTKPFSPRELVARINALLRRRSIAESTESLEVCGLQIDKGRHLVSLDGKSIELTSKEFSLLCSLIEAKGRVLSREKLLETVWGYDRAIHIETRTVDMHIGQLRKKLKSEAHRILTIKNAGYRFEED